MRENLDDEITEVKSENAIDRITSQANPRTLERVPAGARFHVRMVLDVLCDEDKPLLLRVCSKACACSKTTRSAAAARAAAAACASPTCAWCGADKNYYSTGAAEKEISSGATLAAIQAAVNESAFSFVREE